MKTKELENLLRYFYCKTERLEQDVRLFDNAYYHQEKDEEFYLESIIALTRAKAFNEFKNDIERLLNL